MYIITISYSSNMDKVKERLLQFAKSQKLAMMDFYKKTTIASSNFSEKGSESAMSTDKIIHILNVYPELSPDWMLLEKGEMLRKNNAKNVRWPHLPDNPQPTAMPMFPIQPGSSRLLQASSSPSSTSLRPSRIPPRKYNSPMEPLHRHPYGH